MAKRKSPGVDRDNNSTRRRFLGQVGGASAATIAAGAINLEPLLGEANSIVQAQHAESFRNTRPHDHDDRGQGDKSLQDDKAPTGIERVNRAYRIRVDAAQRQRRVPIPAHLDNGDEARYANCIGNFTKGLRHNSVGEVDPAAYDAFLGAIRTGRFADFENLRPFLGCPEPARQRPLVNPEAANAFDLEGTDAAQLTSPPAPAFASAEEAGEMIELYWMSLLRDVGFDDYAINATAQEAAADLSQLSDFRGPKENGQVTAQTLFRDDFPGCTTGPYVSQFLLRQTAFGAQRVDQRINARANQIDYLTQYQAWLDNQNGCVPFSLAIPPATEAPLRFIRDGRDISQYVRLDVLYQAYFVAALILLNGITLNETTSPFVFRFPFDAGNPYGSNGSTPVQAGFATFGNPHIMTLVTEPATRALKAGWYQKWVVHRRLRPEAFGGRVEVMRQKATDYPVHPDLTDKSIVLPRIFSRFGTHLLPQAFPEGSPLHPAYGSGHAVVAGACVTMLKAFFDESTVIQEPVRINPADGGQTTIPYEGPELTVGGELNKLASNIATGRNLAGVHWRTDGVEAIKLGERVAVSMLRDMRETYGEPFGGFSLTTFDNQRITF